MSPVTTNKIMSQKKQSTALTESNEAIRLAVEKLKKTSRGRAALKDFKELWLGYESGEGIALMDSQGHAAIFRLMIESVGGRRDFIHEL
jgi:hypothetical protein